MAHFVAADVAVAILSRGVMGKKRRSYGSITLTTTAATYDNPGGIYLPALTTFGFYKSFDFMFLIPTISSAGTLASDGLLFRYDKTKHTIRCYMSAAVLGHTHDMTYIGGITATEPVAIAAGDTLGKNAATNRTILGADVATKGGVKALAGISAAALAEFTDDTLLGGTSLIIYYDAVGV